MSQPESSINRRDLLTTAVTAGAASVLVSHSVQAEDQRARAAGLPFRIVDTNVSLFQWPFRRLPLDDTEALVEKLRTLGIGEAWAGSFEGILHRDLAGVNRRLAEACRRHPEVTPIGSINLELPGWHEDLRQCVEEHDMPGIRLHPNYHGYRLDDPRFSQLLQRATAAGRFLQIAAAMEDGRTQHPMMRTEDVDLTPLPSLMRATVGARVQILNARLRSPLLERLAATPGISFDTSRVEGTDGVAILLRTVPPDRVMFGTHAPFLIPEAALIRVYESDLGEKEYRSLLAENADQLWRKDNG